MWSYYHLQPTLPGEPDPVAVAVRTDNDSESALSLSIYVVGARTLRPDPNLAPQRVRCVMHAGARLFGGDVRLSDGYNIIELPEWRGQGIGSLALGRMVAWAKQYHAAREVLPVELRSNGTPIAADDPRKRFYERFGLTWSAPAPPPGEPIWHSDAVSVRELHVPALPATLRRLEL